MGRKPSKPKDPTYAAIEAMVAQSGLNATTQEEVVNYSKLFMKAFLERAMQGEMNHFLKEEVRQASLDPEAAGNSRNGYGEKTVSTKSGKVRIEYPRDRRGRFLPRIVPKHSRRFEGFDDQIIGLYARGMSTRDIQSFLKEQYGTDVSPDLISAVTDEVMASVNEWQNRPLEPMYPVVFFDAIRIKIRSASGAVIPKAMHIALAVRADGTKDILGLWLDETESASFWLSVFNELKARGVQDILIAVTDGLKGLPKALETAFPSSTLQTCIVHLIRNSLVCVSQKNRAALAAAVKPIYSAATADAARAALEAFKESELGERYARVADMWESAWDRVIPFFAFSPGIRRLIYTTNAIESLNRTIRKAIKTKGCFSTDEAAKKLVWLSLREVLQKWKRPTRIWSAAMEEMAILYGSRFTDYLE